MPAAKKRTAKPKKSTTKAKKSTAKPKTGSSGRQRIEPTPGSSRFVRRDKGQFTEDQVSVGKSLAADRRTKAKTKVKPGQGDRGDVATGKKSAATKRSTTKKK